MQHKVCNILPIPRRTLSRLSSGSEQALRVRLWLICNPKSLAVSLPCCATFEAAQQVCLTALITRAAGYLYPVSLVLLKKPQQSMKFVFLRNIKNT
jgi:hypothetical protein